MAVASSCDVLVRARVTLLATGANATVINAFGLRAPLKPNAVAGRAYFDVPDHLAAMTYPGTGEGIGKAMESGLLAARLIIDRFASGDPATDVHMQYETEFRKHHAGRCRRICSRSPAPRVHGW